jgi:hypothetical protein
MMAGDDDMGDDDEEAEEEAFAFEDEEVEEAADEEVEEASDEDLDEGATKDAMMKDAEKMSKDAFCKKYGDENKGTWEACNESTKTAGEEMREYVEKVSATMGDNGANTKSAVAGPNDMGGDASNLAQGADEKGRTADTAKEDNAGNVNVPGGKASKSMTGAKGHGAEKKGAGEAADNKTPVVGK